MRNCFTESSKYPQEHLLSKQILDGDVRDVGLTNRDDRLAVTASHLHGNRALVAGRAKGVCYLTFREADCPQGGADCVRIDNPLGSATTSTGATSTLTRTSLVPPWANAALGLIDTITDIMVAKARISLIRIIARAPPFPTPPYRIAMN